MPARKKNLAASRILFSSIKQPGSELWKSDPEFHRNCSLYRGLFGDACPGGSSSLFLRQPWARQVLKLLKTDMGLFMDLKITLVFSRTSRVLHEAVSLQPTAFLKSFKKIKSWQDQKEQQMKIHFFSIPIRSLSTSSTVLSLSKGPINCSIDIFWNCHL